MTRPSVFGNPYPTAVEFEANLKDAIWIVERERQSGVPVEGVSAAFVSMKEIARRLPELRGKNLACWCRLDAPCHADHLLKFANQ